MLATGTSRKIPGMTSTRQYRTCPGTEARPASLNNPPKRGWRGSVTVTSPSQTGAPRGALRWAGFRRAPLLIYGCDNLHMPSTLSNITIARSCHQLFWLSGVAEMPALPALWFRWHFRHLRKPGHPGSLQHVDRPTSDTGKRCRLLGGKRCSDCRETVQNSQPPCRETAQNSAV